MAVPAAGNSGPGATAAASPPSTSQQTHASPPSSTSLLKQSWWEPLAKIQYGFAISAFSPEIDILPQANCVLDEASASALHAHLIALEVGDEVYVFEQLGSGEVEWVRGYVVSANKMPSAAETAPAGGQDSAFISGSQSSQENGLVLHEEPQVYVGVFPASHVHIREHLDDAEMRLGQTYARAKEQGSGQSQTASASAGSFSKIQMETLPEEDENQLSQPNSPSGIALGQQTTIPGDASGQRQTYVPRARRDSSTSSRPPPPLPSLKCGDETLSGATEPLADEIACAIREWGSLMHVYLAKGQYSLFESVRQQIETLHAARRQLLAQTLSEDEVARLRRECVARLVKANVMQGLDVIVRHPTKGGLVTVDLPESAATQTEAQKTEFDSWISGIRLYALQVALAYVDQQQDPNRDSTLLSFPQTDASGSSSNAFGIVSPTTSKVGILGGVRPVATGSRSPCFSLPPSAPPTSHSRLSGRRPFGPNDVFAGATSSCSATSIVNSSNTVKYFHVFMEVRAFIANPCLPGETAELYFSLYNKAEARFLTEEYCVILNHHGFPVRRGGNNRPDAQESSNKSVKMCTIFTNLSSNDMQDLNIVCRIIRNGSMRVANSGSSSLTNSQEDRRGSQHSYRDHPQTTMSPSKSEAGQDERDAGNSPYAGSAGFRSKRMTSDHTFRRPFGCAVLSLGQEHQFEIDTSNSSMKKEHVMPILVPVNEAAFSTLHQDIIASRVREIEKSPRAELIAVDVKVFHGAIGSLVKENPSLLSEAAHTARLGFPDVVFPDDPRNEAYIKLWSGEFYPAGGKMPGASVTKNIQVSIEVRNRSGDVLDNIISRGSGEPKVAQFDSTVFYHQNAPTWGELIKLDLPDEIMEQCHLFLTFRYRSSKEEKAHQIAPGSNVFPSGAPVGHSSAAQNPTAVAIQPPFAHAYLPLFGKNTAFIQDGSHTLFLWRTSRPGQQLSPELYFALPASVRPGRLLSEMVPPSLSGLIQPLRDNIMLRSFLVSTRYTQNDVLLRLLHWEKALSEDVEDLKSVLVKFTFVGEVEIVKFLRDIFDALFSIVVNTRNSNGELDDLVFNALVTVLGIVQDRRFNDFRATLDVYIEHHFHSQTAHTRLMASMARLLADPARTDTSKELRASIKVWPYLFRFIVRSRKNQRNGSANATVSAVGAGAVSDHFETKFRADLDALMRSINRLMAATKPPSIVGTQALALQFFAGILPDLAGTYTVDELVALEASFADSIFITKGRMVVWKLLHLVHIVDGPLFDEASSRSQLIPSIVRWIRPHLGPFVEGLEFGFSDNPSQKSVQDSARITWLEGARLAITVLAITLDRLQTSLLRGRLGEMSAAELRQEQDNVDYILSMVPRILETYKEMEHRETIRALKSHRSPATVASAIPVTFPSNSSFSLIAKRPDGPPHYLAPKSTSRRRNLQPNDGLHFLNCGLGEIAAVLTMLVMLSPRKHLAGFLDEQLDLEGSEKLAVFLSDFFHVATSIIRNEAFPASWLNINILAHQMVLKMAGPLAALMVRDFIPAAEDSENFNTNLWKGCLDMLLTLLSSEQLVIERSQPQRRRAVWRLAGDIRGEGAQVFAKLWNSIGWPDQSVAPSRSSWASDNAPTTNGEANLESQRLNTGGFQVQFIPSLVEPILELCLSHHDELRTCAVRALATMITSEWHLNGNFSVIEAEIIDKLDVLFMSDIKGDEISRAFFIGQLRSMFEPPEVEARLQEQVFACLLSVNRFLDLLLNVRSLPLAEGYEDDRIAGTLKLLGFLRQADRVTAFSTHVLRLVNLHLNNLNFVEAALTLKLHADLHTWEMDSFVDSIPELSLPRQSHFARRETLYMLILDYLGKGQAWEIAIDICRELAQQYEYRAIDYMRLAELLAYQATLYRKVVQTDRTFPTYFQVSYYGDAWPQPLQQKMFVYRGTELEKPLAFCERMQQKHPGATLLRSSAPPGDDVKFAAGMQYLQITALQPEPDRTRDVFVNPDVPATVRAYYEHNATNLFSFSRPLRQPDELDVQDANVSLEAGNVVDLWIEKTYLRCEDAFPSVLRRSEVVEVYVVDISPLEKALSDVDAKTAELVGLERKYLAFEEVHPSGDGRAAVNTNRLSMALNGAVDAPVNGGIQRYKRMFLSQPRGSDGEQSEKLDAQDDALLGKLREAINRQAVVISRCIHLHARLCPPEMRPFHETLVGFFEENFAEEIEGLGLREREGGLDDKDGQVREENGGQAEDTISTFHPLTRLGKGPTQGRLSAGAGYGSQASDASTSVSLACKYALDSNVRLQQVSADTGTAFTGKAGTPLQLHVALLARQASIPATPAKELNVCGTDTQASGLVGVANKAETVRTSKLASSGEGTPRRSGLSKLVGTSLSSQPASTPSTMDDIQQPSGRGSALDSLAVFHQTGHRTPLQPQSAPVGRISSGGFGTSHDEDGTSTRGGRSIFSQAMTMASSHATKPQNASRLSRLMSVRGNKR